MSEEAASLSRCVFQKARVECLWQEFANVYDFTLPVQICECDLRVLGVFPDDLSARTARRSQLFGINDNNQIGEVTLALGQRFGYYR